MKFARIAVLAIAIIAGGIAAILVSGGEDAPAPAPQIVQEAALHACNDAVSYYDLPLTLFEPLVPLMSRLPAELIGYVLGILGSTRDPAARPVIASYAGHPDRFVRAEAADALVELAGRPAEG